MYICTVAYYRPWISVSNRFGILSTVAVGVGSRTQYPVPILDEDCAASYVIPPPRLSALLLEGYWIIFYYIILLTRGCDVSRMICGMLRVSHGRHLILVHL